jgi:hypothetical protein
LGSEVRSMGFGQLTFHVALHPSRDWLRIRGGCSARSASNVHYLPNFDKGLEAGFPGCLRPADQRWPDHYDLCAGAKSGSLMASTLSVYRWRVICPVSCLWRLPNLEKLRSNNSLDRIRGAKEHFESCLRKHTESKPLHILDVGHRSNPFDWLARNTSLRTRVYSGLLSHNGSQFGNHYSFI